MANLEKFASELKNMSEAQLAELRRGQGEDHERTTLIQREWTRRDREHQHKLDLDSIAKQVRWMKFAVVASILSVIIGAFLTYFLSQATEEKYLNMIQEMSKRQVIQSPPPLSSEILPSHPSQKAKDGKIIYKESSGVSYE